MNDKDNVNHPTHYETGKFECIEVMLETQGIEAVQDFCICNAFKYLYRHKNKNADEDIKKAIWYLNKYLELRSDWSVTGVTAKEYLNQARTLDMLINTKQSELYKLRLMATSVSSPSITEKVQSSGDNTAMRIIDKIVDLQNEINLEIDKLVDLKSQIRGEIKQINDPVERILLTERYINNKSWMEIANMMHYTERQVHNIHGKSLKHFSKFH